MIHALVLGEVIPYEEKKPDDERKMIWMAEKWQMRRGLGTGGRGLGGDEDEFSQNWSGHEGEWG